MDQSEIIRYVAETFPGVDIVIGDQGIAEGDTFFIYDPDRNLEDKQRIPFATIVTKDYGDFDKSSNLNRPGVYRLNIGVSRDTFRSVIGRAPSSYSSSSSAPEPTTTAAREPSTTAAPEPSNAVSPEPDHAALDQLLPHPFYAPQSWICVLNPSDETFARLKPLLAEAYDLMVKRQKARRRQPTG